MLRCIFFVFALQLPFLALNGLNLVHGDMKYCESMEEIVNLVVQYRECKKDHEICNFNNILTSLQHYDDEFYKLTFNSEEIVLYSSNGYLHYSNCLNVSEIWISNELSDCTKHLPIEFSLNGTKKIGFLTKQSIIRSISSMINCDFIPDFYFVGNNTIIRRNSTLEVVTHGFHRKLLHIQSNISDTVDDDDLNSIFSFYDKHAKNNYMYNIVTNVFLLILMIKWILKMSRKMTRVFLKWTFFSDQHQNLEDDKNISIVMSRDLIVTNDPIINDKSKSSMKDNLSHSDRIQKSDLQKDKFILDDTKHETKAIFNTLVNENDDVLRNDIMVVENEVKKTILSENKCNCKGTCDSKKCGCFKNMVKCGPLCHLESECCKNKK
jgi:hypothetical protein